MILASVPDGHKVKVSLGEHDILTESAEPAGGARLWEVGSSVIAHGHIYDTPRGAALRTKLLAGGPRTQWSIGWPTAPEAGFKSRPPSEAELKRWPDARRIVTAWSPVEISPVSAGACGPSCRTIAAKCAGQACKCGCSSSSKTPDPTLLKAVTRFRDREACHREPLGALAWNAAQDGTRWLTGGVLQEGPSVKFVPFDGKRLGYWRPGDDVVHVARGLSAEQTISTVMHEVSHWFRAWDPSEDMARSDADHLTRRFMRQFAA